MKLGVDFGTTRTVVAHADRGNYPVVSFFDERGDAHDWFPSVVAEKGGELFFGFDALALGESASVVRSFKRLLSDQGAVPGRMVQVGALTLGLGELVERFLVGLRVALETRSNLRAEESAPIKGKGKAKAKTVPVAPSFRSVVAVPANAHGAQRFVTLDAFRRAGFAPVAMLNEPSAAGFEYTHRHRGTLTSKRDNVVVYDLGGGTFDASLVRMRGNRHEVLATAGVNQLGGDDFDDALVGLVCDAAKLSRAELSPRALERLIDQCRDAKERLNPSSRKIAIDLEHVLGEPRPEAIVQVADFYEACAPLVERSIDAMAPVMARLEQAGIATDADGLPDDIAGIYVVGGASELPIVARALRERFGRRVHRSPYPSAAIAIGLAIACDDEAGFELADRYSRTFGVFREGAAGGEITLDPIFTSDTSLPEHRAAEGDERPPGAAVTFRRDYRAAHNVGHFRFFECSAVGEDGRPRGDMTVSGDVLFPFAPELGEVGDLRGVPVERIGAGPRIEEEYSLDENGIVAVTIRNVDLGYERAYRIGASDVTNPNEKQITKLRAAWDKAVEKDRPKDAIEPLVGLEKLEPREPRWPHRLGDLYRRLGRAKDSEAAYERALKAYQQGGFLARAVAMAKTIVAMNPARAAVLGELDPDAARALRRQSRPEMFFPKAAPQLVPSAPPAPPPGQSAPPRPQVAGIPAHRVDAVALAPKLRQAADQAQDEVRFDDLTAEPSVEIDIYELDPSLAALPDEPVDVPTREPPVPSAERLSVMTGAALFADVAREVLVELTRAAALEEHAPGARLFQRGAPATSLYLIVEGRARVELPELGVHADLGEGQVFGEGCLLEGGTRGADVVAETALTVLSIPKADLDRVVAKEPPVGNVLFDLLVKRLVANALQTLPLFASFDLETRVELARLFEVRRASAGVVLKQIGKRSDGLYIPLAGELGVERPGRTWTVPLGQVFGQQSLLTSAPSNHTITVVREAVVLRLPATRFGSFAAQYAPALAALSELAVEADAL